MNKNPDYSLQFLDGVPYLLPYGQNVADQRGGVQLNEAGALLWRLIDNAPDPNALGARYLRHAAVEPEHQEEALADVSRFLDNLAGAGLLDRLEAPQEPEYCCLAIGPLALALRGEAEFFSPELLLFQTAEAVKPDQTVTVTRSLPPPLAGSVCLLHNRELEVFCGKERYYLRFPNMPSIRLAVLSPDGSEVCIHVTPGDDRDSLRFDLFHAIRHGFLYLAQRKGCFALHSASILYRDRVWLFSAPSGTGKSTQAGLWQKTCGVPILNGDLALLGSQAGQILFYPMPWCGTSGIAERVTAPLGGVILLRQARENTLTVPPFHRQQLLLANRMISPVWEEAQLARNLAFAGQLAHGTSVWRYGCTKEQESVAVLKAAIDQSLEEGSTHG